MKRSPGRPRKKPYSVAAILELSEKHGELYRAVTEYMAAHPGGSPTAAIEAVRELDQPGSTHEVRVLYRWLEPLFKRDAVVAEAASLGPWDHEIRIPTVKLRP